LTPAIAPGSSVDVTFPGVGVSCRAGCSFVITVDSQSQVPETNETNNTANGLCVVIGFR
jgi:subtilase family serine protease